MSQGPSQRPRVSSAGARRAARWLVLSMIALLPGCTSLHALSQAVGFLRGLDPPRLVHERDARAFLMGVVSVEPQTHASVVVYVYREDRNGLRVANSQRLPQPGPFAFVVAPGRYRVAAYEDPSGVCRYGAADGRASVYHDGATIIVMPGDTIDRLYLRLHGDPPQHVQLACRYREGVP